MALGAEGSTLPDTEVVRETQLNEVVDGLTRPDLMIVLGCDGTSSLHSFQGAIAWDYRIDGHGGCRSAMNNSVAFR